MCGREGSTELTLGSEGTALCVCASEEWVQAPAACCGAQQHFCRPIIYSVVQPEVTTIGVLATLCSESCRVRLKFYLQNMPEKWSNHWQQSEKICHQKFSKKNSRCLYTRNTILQFLSLSVDNLNLKHVRIALPVYCSFFLYHKWQYNLVEVVTGAARFKTSSVMFSKMGRVYGQSMWFQNKI